MKNKNIILILLSLLFIDSVFAQSLRERWQRRAQRRQWRDYQRNLLCNVPAPVLPEGRQCEGTFIPSDIVDLAIYNSTGGLIDGVYKNLSIQRSLRFSNLVITSPCNIEIGSKKVLNSGIGEVCIKTPKSLIIGEKARLKSRTKLTIDAGQAIFIGSKSKIRTPVFSLSSGFACPNLDNIKLREIKTFEGKCFEANPDPVSVFTTAINGDAYPLTINVDASGSEAVNPNYEWYVNNELIGTGGPSFNFNIATPGAYKISLKIIEEDGDEAFSENEIFLDSLGNSIDNPYERFGDGEGPTFEANPSSGRVFTGLGEITLKISDPAGVDFNSLQVSLNNTPFADNKINIDVASGIVKLNVSNDFAAVIPNAENMTINISVKDVDGNPGTQTYIYALEEAPPVDTLGPQFFFPQNNESNVGANQIEAIVSDPSGISQESLRVLVNGEEIPSTQFSYDPVLGKVVITLSEENLASSTFQVIEIQAADSASNEGSGSIGIDNFKQEFVVLDDNTDTIANPFAPNNNYSCLQLASDDLRCWGINIFGVMGIGRNIVVGSALGVPMSESINSKVGGKISSYSQKGEGTCVIMKEGEDAGKVRCFGYGFYGQLGIQGLYSLGGSQAPTTEEPLDFGEPVHEVAVGLHFVCVRYGDGKLKCFGRNDFGQLGLGDTEHRGDDESIFTVPDVPLDGKVRHVAAGYYHACAVLEDGRVKCWGRNNGGQLGYGNIGNIGDNEPISSVGYVGVGTNIQKIEANFLNTCALFDNGRVKCWGHNSSGNLGLGYISNGLLQLPSDNDFIPFTRSVTDITSGFEHYCALLDNGTAHCWGRNSSGQIGVKEVERVGDDEPANGYDPIRFPERITSIHGFAAHTCAVMDNQKARCWGGNRYGELGLDSTILAIGDDEDVNKFGYVLVDEPFKLPDGYVPVPRPNIDIQLKTTQYYGPGSRSVLFDASKTLSVNGDIESYSWDFGNENVFVESSGIISQDYFEPGNYTAMLTVTDSSGETASFEQNITIRERDLAPFVIASADNDYGRPFFPLTFDASSSFDPLGSLKKVSWDFGDGSFLNLEITDGSELIQQKSFGAPGLYLVTITVEGEAGRKSQEKVIPVVILL